MAITAHGLPATRRPPRPLAVVSIFYGVTLVAAGLLGLVQPVLGLDPVVLQLTQFGPLLGVLAVGGVWARRWRPRVVTGLRTAPGLRAALTVPVAVGAIFVLILAGYRLTGHDVQVTAPASLAAPFWLIVVAQVVGACGEEVGWRAFLQPYLRSRLGVVPTGALVGLLWGAWHVGIFGAGLAYAAGFLVASVALSVILVVVLDRARGQQLLLAGAFHAAVNLGLLVLLPEEKGDSTAMVVFAGACAVTALAVLAGSRRPAGAAR